ncbi:MAG TPA: hypothetical protein VM532_15375 [Burkholderiales bacterium]|nr:hypothetical protein [Burkholderiales bacterium]
MACRHVAIPRLARSVVVLKGGKGRIPVVHPINDSGRYCKPAPTIHVFVYIHWNLDPIKTYMSFKSCLAALTCIAIMLITSTASFAALTACQTNNDCSSSAPICRELQLPRLPPKICVPIAAVHVSSTNGADPAEFVQEQFINVMFADLAPRLPHLHSDTSHEMQAALNRELQRHVVDFATLRDGFDRSYMAIARLDAHERLLLVRYLKRQLATSLEKHLFIMHDIVHHPNAVSANVVASLDQRIEAESARLDGMVHDRQAQCNQFHALENLQHQKIDAVYERTVEKIEASNITPEQRRRKREHAEFTRRQGRETVSSVLGAACSGSTNALGAPSLGPVRSAASRGPTKLFTLYSLDAPDVPLVANARGVPPITTGRWDRLSVGKAAVQRQTQTSERQRLKEARRQPELQAYDEKAHAHRLLDEESKAAREGCTARAMALANKRNEVGNRFRSEREPLLAQISAISREIEAAACPSHLNVMGCNREKQRLIKERTESLSRRLEQLKEEEQRAHARFNEEGRANEGTCKADMDAVQQRYTQRINGAADRIAALPTSVPSAGTAPLSNYDALQDYDVRGEFQPLNTTEKWWLKRMATFAGAGAVQGLLQHARGGAAPAMPPTPVSLLQVAAQFKQLSTVQTDRDKACWGLGLHRIILGSITDTDSVGLDKAMNDFINFPQPGAPAARACSWAEQR